MLTCIARLKINLKLITLSGFYCKFVQSHFTLIDHITSED